MAAITFFKTVSAPPAGPTYEPNACYFVRVGDGFDVWITNSDGTAIHKHNAAGGSSSANYRYLNLAGRINAGSSDPWYGPHSTGGAGFGTWSHSVGGTTDPTLSPISQGPLLYENEVIKRIELFYRGNNAQVDKIQYHIDAHYFDVWDGTDDTPAAQTIHHEPESAVDETSQFRVVHNPDVTIAQDSMLIPKFKVTVGGTSTRYVMFDMTVVIETTDIFA